MDIDIYAYTALYAQFVHLLVVDLIFFFFSHFHMDIFIAAKVVLSSCVFDIHKNSFAFFHCIEKKKVNRFFST